MRVEFPNTMFMNYIFYFKQNKHFGIINIQLLLHLSAYIIVFHFWSQGNMCDILDLFNIFLKCYVDKIIINKN